MTQPLTAHLHNAAQAHGVLTGVWAQAKPMLLAGNKLTLELRPYDSDKTAAQRRYYHGYVLTEIASKASPAGVKYALPVWKEHFRKKFLGENGCKRRTFVDPMTGKKSRRQVRMSTENLGVKAYAALIEKVTAFATVDLGIRFSETLATWVDTETGEVHGL